MKKQILFGLAVLAGVAAGVAQPQAKGVARKLVSAPGGLMAPVWSPDGSRLAATTDNYAGIIVMNADGSAARTLTNSLGAGYKMTWSLDGTEIIGRTNIAENGRVYHEIKAWNTRGGGVRTLRAKFRGNTAPTLKAAGLTRKTAGVYDIMTADAATAASQIEALAQYAGEVIINPALSPDGTKVAFQIPGKGMWIINSNGTGLRSLGKGSNPQWMPDSRNLVYTLVSDNGQVYTASTLYGLDTENGRRSVIVNAPGIIPLTPAVSPDGTKVVFQNSSDASLYIVNLK